MTNQKTILGEFSSIVEKVLSSSEIETLTSEMKRHIRRNIMPATTKNVRSSGYGADYEIHFEFDFDADSYFKEHLPTIIKNSSIRESLSQCDFSSLDLLP